MTDLFDDPDLYDDITPAAGCDLVWGFDLSPWDATGASASFVVGSNSYAVAITVTGDGTDKISTFQVHLTPAQMVSLGLTAVSASASYAILYTDALGVVSRIGHGTILVT